MNKMKALTLVIAKGKRGEPKIWFTSMESFAKVLSDRNRALLNLIAEAQPDSLAELAALSGRAKSNLSRTLHTMERYGLVLLKKNAGGKNNLAFHTAISRWTFPCDYEGSR